jgi:hypothetical protein
MSGVEGLGRVEGLARALEHPPSPFRIFVSPFPFWISTRSRTETRVAIGQHGYVPLTSPAGTPVQQSLWIGNRFRELYTGSQQLRVMTRKVHRIPLTAVPQALPCWHDKTLPLSRWTAPSGSIDVGPGLRGSANCSDHERRIRPAPLRKSILQCQGWKEATALVEVAHSAWSAQAKVEPQRNGCKRFKIVPYFVNDTPPKKTV